MNISNILFSTKNIDKTYCKKYFLDFSRQHLIFLVKCGIIDEKNEEVT